MVSVGGVSGGGLTYALLHCLKTMTPDITFNDMLISVRSKISSLGLNQNPSLMAGNLFFNPSSKKISDFLNI